VIFLFKYPSDETPRDAPLDGEFDYAALEPSQDGDGPVWFAAQTIQNACGTQALLAVLLNKDGPQDEGGVDIGPNLREFKEFTSAFPSEACGPLLVTLRGCLAQMPTDH
jgi:ubiquitin carboxyl-terminal hydrolase L5